MTALRAAPPPAWAHHQLESICLRAQVEVPVLAWSRGGEDSGAYHPCPPAISVQETFEPAHRVEAEITFLHELAHHLAHQVALSSSHSPAFWEICWRLYLDQGVPLDLAVYGEFSYDELAEPALRALEPCLDPAVEAAGAYGTACRRSDRLEVEIRRLEAKAALVPAALGFQADLVRLRMAHAQICLEAQGALQAWQCHLATPRPMPAGAARSPEGALAEATWPNSPLAVPAIPREGAGALSAHSAAPRQVF